MPTSRRSSKNNGNTASSDPSQAASTTSTPTNTISASLETECKTPARRRPIPGNRKRLSRTAPASASPPVASRTRSRVFHDQRLTRSATAARRLSFAASKDSAKNKPAATPRRAPKRRSASSMQKANTNNDAKRQRVSSDEDRRSGDQQPNPTSIITAPIILKEEIEEKKKTTSSTTQASSSNTNNASSSRQAPGFQRDTALYDLFKQETRGGHSSNSPFGSGLGQFMVFDSNGTRYYSHLGGSSGNSMWQRFITGIRDGNVATLNELCDTLLMGNEETLHSFPSKQCVLELTKILQKDPYSVDAPPDLAELQLLSIRAVTYLMEALPRSTAYILDIISDILKFLLVIQCIDTAEQALLCLYKLAQQRQGKILLSKNAPFLCLNHIDFFSTGSQQYALEICHASFQTLSKVSAVDFEANPDYWMAIENVWPMLSSGILKNNNGDKRCSYYALQSVLQIVQSCTGFMSSNTAGIIVPVVTGAENNAPGQELVPVPKTVKKTELFKKLFLESDILETLVGLFKMYVESRTILEDSQQYNPFLSILKILSISSKQIACVPNKLYELDLVPIILSTLDFILTDPSETSATTSTSVSSPPTTPQKPQSPSTTRAHSTQLIFEILIQVIPRTHNEDPVLIPVSTEASTSEPLPQGTDPSQSPRVTESDTKFAEHFLRDTLLYLDDRQARSYLARLKADFSETPELIANFANESVPADTVSRLLEISFMLYNSLPTNTPIAGHILYLLDLLACSMPKRTLEALQNAANSQGPVKVPEEQWRPISPIITSLLQDQQNLKKIARASHIVNALLARYGDKLPSQFKRDGMLFEMKSVEAALKSRISEQDDTGAPEAGFRSFTGNYNMRSAHRIYTQWCLVSIADCVRKLEAITRFSVTDGMLETVSIQLKSSAESEAVLFGKVKECLIGKPFSVYEIRSSQILLNLFARLHDTSKSLESRRLSYATFLKVFDKPDLEALVTIVQNVLGSKFSSLPLNSYHVARTGSSSIEATHFKHFTQGQVRLSIDRPLKPSADPNARPTSTSSILVRVDPMQSLSTIGKFLLDRGYCSLYDALEESPSQDNISGSNPPADTTKTSKAVAEPAKTTTDTKTPVTEPESADPEQQPLEEGEDAENADDYDDYDDSGDEEEPYQDEVADDDMADFIDEQEAEREEDAIEGLEEGADAPVGEPSEPMDDGADTSGPAKKDKKKSKEKSGGKTGATMSKMLDEFTRLEDELKALRKDGTISGSHQDLMKLLTKFGGSIDFTPDPALRGTKPNNVLKFYYKDKELSMGMSISELIALQLKDHYPDEKLSAKPINLEKFWGTHYKLRYRIVPREEKRSDDGRVVALLKEKVDSVVHFYNCELETFQMPQYGTKLDQIEVDEGENIFDETKHPDFGKMFEFLQFLHELVTNHRELGLPVDMLQVFGPLEQKGGFIDRSAFYNPVLTAQVTTQSNNIFSMASKSFPDWLWKILEKYPWLLPFEIRKTFFDMVFLDLDRTNQTLIELSEQNRGTNRQLSSVAPNQPEMASGRARLKRKRYYISRTRILKDAEQHFSTTKEISSSSSKGDYRLPKLDSLTKMMTDAYTCIVSPTRRTRRQRSLSSEGDTNSMSPTSGSKRHPMRGVESTGAIRTTDSTPKRPKSSSIKMFSRDGLGSGSIQLLLGSSSLGQSFKIHHLDSSIEFSFTNEVGTGTGPTLEFYNMIVAELLTKTSIFNVDEETQVVSFTRPKKYYSTKFCGEIERHCLLLGRLLARAFLDNRQVPLRLSPWTWRSIIDSARQQDLVKNGIALTGEKKLAYALCDINDPTLFNSVAQMAKATLDGSFQVNGCDIADLYLGFAPQMRKLKNVDVDASNIKAYLASVAQEQLEIAAILPSFYVARGMMDVFSGLPRIRGRGLDNLSALQWFLHDPDELNRLFGGESVDSWTTREILEAFTCGHGYDSNSQQLFWLAEFMIDLTVQEKKQFLTFVTGGPNSPVGGLKSYRPPLKLVRKLPEDSGTSADEMLPSAMTCQNYLKLPQYSTKEILATKMRLAFTEGSQHFLLS